MNTVPAAIDSPADPVVCTMLLRRIDDLPPVAFVTQRKIVIESTAIGIDALTVSPILSARYTLDAAKTIGDEIIARVGHRVHRVYRNELPS